MTEETNKAPRLVGYGEGGKPRMRVRADFDFDGLQNPYRNLENEKGYSDVRIMPDFSARDDVRFHRAKVRRNAVDAERNSEQVRGGFDRKANIVVGATLTPQPLLDTRWIGLEGEEAIDAQIDWQEAAKSVFREWGEDPRLLCDAERHLNFGAQMWMAFRTLIGPDGEVAGIIRYDEERRDAYGGKFATYVEWIQPARISNPMGKNNGDKMRDPYLGIDCELHDGKLLDRDGAMTGFWVSSRHPAETGSSPMYWDFVPREDPRSGRAIGIHWFFKRSPGQTRGMSSLFAILASIDMLKRFDKATLETAAANALIATYIKTEMEAEKVAQHLSPRDEFDGASEFDVKLDAYDKMNLRFGNKRIPVLGPNDSIEALTFDKLAMDYDPFRNAFLRELASSLGVSFEQLSLDFSKVSYSSARTAILESWRQVMVERTMFSQHVASLIYDAVIEEAVMLGILEIPEAWPIFDEARPAYTRAIFTGPGMGWVDPDKEIEAARKRSAFGVSSLQEESANQGTDWNENLKSKAAVERMAKRYGTTIDYGGGGAAAQNRAEDGSQDGTGAPGAQQQESVDA